MSETYTRKQVKSPAITPIVAGGAILAVTLGASLLKSLSQSAKEAYRVNLNSTSTKPLSMNRNISLLETAPRIGSNKILVSPTETIKVSTLLALNNSDCVVDNSESLKNKIVDLQAANSEAAARKAQHYLYQELEQNHQRLFIKSLVVACKEASIKAGFTGIETKQSTSGSSVRVIASDAQGRALVTEIATQNSRDTQMVSELIGVRDGSCKHIMNLFDQALQEQGVQSLPPERKFTGGVCETNVAIEFLRKAIQRDHSTRIKLYKNDENRFRRIKNLNQKNTIKSKY